MTGDAIKLTYPSASDLARARTRDPVVAGWDSETYLTELTARVVTNAEHTLLAVEQGWERRKALGERKEA